MSTSSSYTEKEIKQLVRDAAVKAALKDQKDAHDEVIQSKINTKWSKGGPLAVIVTK